MATIEGCAVDLSRVQIDGEPLSLAPHQAMAVNLTLHELCTNAIKYGALSTEAGHVAISWSVQNGAGARKVRLLWKEHDGPSIERPQTKGYGTQLIETLVPYELHGEVQLHFKVDGLSCELLSAE
jgi:two-component sensor histidine kinase